MINHDDPFCLTGISKLACTDILIHISFRLWNALQILSSYKRLFAWFCTCINPPQVLARLCAHCHHRLPQALPPSSTLSAPPSPYFYCTPPPQPPCSSAQEKTFSQIIVDIVTRSSCEKWQGASADKLQVTAASILPFVGLPESSMGTCSVFGLPLASRSQHYSFLVSYRAKTLPDTLPL